MIEFDQPKIFGDKIVAALSSIDDGNMKFGASPEEEVRNNREQFLRTIEVDPLQATLVRVTYEDNTDFTRYDVFDEDRQGEGVLSPDSMAPADAAVVTRPGHTLFLLLADCIGAIIYDPREKIMMVSHLGRHSLEQDGARKSIEFLVSEFDSDPERLLVWLSPAAGPESYPLHAFDGRGLIEVASEQLMQAGINPENVEISATDTTNNPEYYSHSQYLAGEREVDGRFAVVAMMIE